MVRKVAKLKAITPDGDTFKATALEWYAMKLDGWSVVVKFFRTVQ